MHVTGNEVPGMMMGSVMDAIEQMNGPGVSLLLAGWLIDLLGSLPNALLNFLYRLICWQIFGRSGA